jgi:transcriptional regulator with XRE-family HTH domain
MIMAKRKRSSPGAQRQAVQFGAKLRERRRELDMTLDQVAQATGLTTGFVSDVERDQASPSVNSLLALCEVLGLRVGTLFDGADTSIIRRGERRPIKFGGIGIQDFLLSPNSQTRFQAILSEMQPDARGSEDLYSLRADEVFVMAMDGEIMINLNGEQTHLLAGDCMTYDPRIPHSFNNPSRTRKATALFIITPPPY